MVTVGLTLKQLGGEEEDNRRLGTSQEEWGKVTDVCKIYKAGVRLEVYVNLKEGTSRE